MDQDPMAQRHPRPDLFLATRIPINDPDWSRPKGYLRYNHGRPNKIDGPYLLSTRSNPGRAPMDQRHRRPSQFRWCRAAEQSLTWWRCLASTQTVTSEPSQLDRKHPRGVQNITHNMEGSLPKSGQWWVLAATRYGSTTQSELQWAIPAVPDHSRCGQVLHGLQWWVVDVSRASTWTRTTARWWWPVEQLPPRAGNRFSLDNGSTAYGLGKRGWEDGVWNVGRKVLYPGRIGLAPGPRRSWRRKLGRNLHEGGWGDETDGEGPPGSERDWVAHVKWMTGGVTGTASARRLVRGIRLGEWPVGPTCRRAPASVWER
jgi:hypothetical protein